MPTMTKLNKYRRSSNPYDLVAEIRSDLDLPELNEVPLAVLRKFAEAAVTQARVAIYDLDIWDVETHAALSGLFKDPREELLPCPFCGFKPDLEHDDCLYQQLSHKNDGRITQYSLNCYDSAGGCGAQVLGETEAAVIARWNNRTPT